MKSKLNVKELEMVSGGFLKREKNGYYKVIGRSDVGFEMAMNFKNFYEAIEEDWFWFKKQYKKIGIKDEEELKFYYNFGDF